MLPTMYDHYRDQVREIAIRQALADAQREANVQAENDVVDDAALSA